MALRASAPSAILRSSLLFSAMIFLSAERQRLGVAHTSTFTVFIWNKAMVVPENHEAFYGSSTGTAWAFQISRAYSRTVRSMENLPILATLRMDMRVQRAGLA